MKARSAAGPSGRAAAAKLARDAGMFFAVSALVGLGALSFLELPAQAAVAAKSLAAWSGLLSEAGESYYGFGLESPEMQEWRLALARSDAKDVRDRAETLMEEAKARSRVAGSGIVWIPRRAVERLSASAQGLGSLAAERRREAALAALSASLADGESDEAAMGKARAAASMGAKSKYPGGLLEAAGTLRSCEGSELGKDFMPWMKSAPQCLGNGRGMMLAYWLVGFLVLFLGLLGSVLGHGLAARASKSGQAWAQSKKVELEAQWEKEQIESQVESGAAPDKAKSRRL
jgi:hypothetical protein